MAGIFNGPARGGTRGGRNEFKWEDVKSDKDRENYIGHSLKASVGRWQKNRDIFWYTRSKSSSSSGGARPSDELAAIQAAEARRMNAVLRGESMPSPERNLEETNLDSVEMKKLLTGDSGAYGDEGPPQKELEEEERVKFKNIKGSRGGHEKLEGIGHDDGDDSDNSDGTETHRHRSSTSGDAGEKKSRKREKKEEKKEKRQLKMMKKEMKRKKKEKKKIKKLLDEKLKGKGIKGVGTAYGDVNL